MRYKLIVGLIVILLGGHSLLAGTGFRKYAGEFMSIDVSARAQAMGGAFSALANDVYATFYNPAGLVQIQSMQLAFTHTQQFLASVNYDYIGFTKPISENKAFGLSLIRLGVDNIKDSRSAAIFDDNGILQSIDQSRVEKFNSADYVFFFSLSQRFRSNLLLGFNVKLIRRDLADHSANGLGFDIGALYLVSDRFRVSAMIRNPWATLIAWDTGEKELVQPQIRLGTTYRIPLPALDSYLIPNFDFVIDTQNAPNLAENSLGPGLISGAVGGELVFKNRLFIRGGYDDLQRVNLGLGLQIPHLNLDYSFTSYDQELGNAHRIGVLVAFNK